MTYYADIRVYSHIRTALPMSVSGSEDCGRKSFKAKAGTMHVQEAEESSLKLAVALSVTFTFPFTYTFGCTVTSRHGATSIHVRAVLLCSSCARVVLLCLSCAPAFTCEHFCLTGLAQAAPLLVLHTSCLPGSRSGNWHSPMARSSHSLDCLGHKVLCTRMWC